MNSTTASCGSARSDTQARSESPRSIEASPYPEAGASDATSHRPSPAPIARGAPVPGRPRGARASGGAFSRWTTQYR